MRELPFKPLQAGYSVEPDDGVQAIKLDGGASRLEIISQGNVGVANVSWALDQYQYSVLKAFHRLFLRSLEPFSAELIIDSSSSDRYECLFVPDTLRLTGKSGSVYFVSAQLEVTPLDSYLDEESDWISQYYNLIMEYGGLRQFLEMTNRLQKLVNVDWPDAAS